ncbi:uncharacterized protein LOC129005611 [Macrosteles quadrilineatus]|uniref:uncharacterized protein LOC129005265 n=1 Tax=Macrosteles quadrilineatus TaxID=74068 RepID=UPI0023E2DA37|nr:uncharacterized protein LOC129005265 [Macrosteles quadrilineatus]XP_054290537.1 uncharacterized protein LOC129005611 [Macrosteles quadrilineatus]
MMKEKERERRRKRRALKQIKGINDLSERGKTKQGAEWRKGYHKHALKKHQHQHLTRVMDEDSPPNSPISAMDDPHEHELHRRSKEEKRVQRKKRLRRSREKYRKKIDKLEKKLKDQRKIAEKWKKKHI